MTQDPELGQLASALNGVNSDWYLLQQGTRETWLKRMTVDLECALRAVEMLQRRQK
jgi:hypothetical protein